MVLGSLYRPADEDGLVDYWLPSRFEGQIWHSGLGKVNLQNGTDPAADTSDAERVSSDSPIYVAFDGDDGAVDVNSDVTGHVTDITGEIAGISTVFFPSLGCIQGLLFRGSSISAGATLQYMLQVNTAVSSDITFQWGDDFAIQSIGVVVPDPLGKWMTVAFSARWGANNNQELYRNAAVIDSGTNANAMASVPTDPFFTLGAALISPVPTTFTSQLTGRLGPTLLYNKYKNLSEIKAIHNDIREQFPSFRLPEA